MLKAFFVFKIEIKLIFKVESLVVLMLFLYFVSDEKKAFKEQITLQIECASVLKGYMYLPFSFFEHFSKHLLECRRHDFYDVLILRFYDFWATMSTMCSTLW